MDIRTEEEPALTPELQSIIQPRVGWPLVVTLLLAAVLGMAALMSVRLLFAGSG